MQKVNETEMEKKIEAKTHEIRGIDHIGLTVPDIEEATEFFKKVFNAKVCYDVHTPDMPPQRGKSAKRNVNLPEGTSIDHIRLLRIGNTPCVELFHIKTNKQSVVDTIVNFGLTHLAFYTDNIELSAKKFVEAGGTLCSDPHPLPSEIEGGEKNYWVYGQAPWGSLIELISYSSGIHYPEKSEVDRWTPDC
ncbi:VOC family protein [Neobacillus cucumis]|uniref:VOC family protein n=1 Tax=Neobacillus cucumis TaxID=1740721 RepID=UPI00203D1BF5|nr:VOC family protein [Neobacillus cucumis]MCM3727861.1 VOC family protein [Neobacillus cucumis]